MANNYWKERNKPYSPGQSEIFKVSRSKIELFTQCPRCFWLDARLKIKRPNGPPFRINSAIDELFKKEFDIHRQAGTKHPLQIKFKVDAIPYPHKDLDKWRANFTGVATVHEPTNLHIFGALDDVWINTSNELMVVDYKATAKSDEITSLGPIGGWQDSYRRQMEVYQWLLRANGHNVSNIGYFVYANGDVNADGFNDVVKFRTNVFSHNGSDKWVESTLIKMKDCLEGDIPAVGSAAMGGPCDYCDYARQRTELTIKALHSKNKKL